MTPTQPGERPFEILLVEDAPGDVRLTFEAFKKSTVETRLSVVGDGAEALDFLFRRGGHRDSPRPDMILLDLNLPKVNGHEVLQQVKGDPGLKRIPVVVLSSSNNEDDIKRAYDAHANCYLLKPTDLREFFGIIRSFEDFWLSLVKLPVP